MRKNSEEYVLKLKVGILRFLGKTIDLQVVMELLVSIHGIYWISFYPNSKEVPKRFYQYSPDQG